MAQYALPNQSVAREGLSGWVRYVNDTSDGLMLPFFLLGAAIIMIVSQLEYGFNRAFLTTMFIISILSTLLWVVGLLAPMWFYASLILLAFAIMLQWLTSRGQGV